MKKEYLKILDGMAHGEILTLHEITTAAQQNNERARKVISEIFHEEITVLFLMEISNECFNRMSEIEQNRMVNKSLRKLETWGRTPIVSDELIQHIADTAASKVATMRIEQKMTQKELAQKAGLNIRHLQKIELNEVKMKNVTVETAMALAKALNTTVEYIMSEEG